jgi:CelD/BcsL family acetyltransferase involved in cellulose biosynthesis
VADCPPPELNRVPPTTSVARSIDALEKLAPQWDALADAVDAPLFSRPFWCIPWTRHMRAGTPEVNSVTENGELTGVAPLSVRSVGGLELVRFLGHGLGTVSALVTRPEDSVQHELWSQILRGRRRFAQLLELRTDDVEHVVSPGWPHAVAPHEVCPTVSCETDFETYLDSRPKKLRENLRRAERALASGGRRHAVELVTTPDRWREVRPEVLSVFDAAEAAQPRHHMFRGPLAAFTDDFVASSATAGRLRLFVGRVDGTPVSFGIAFAAGQTLSYWVTRFDPGFAAASVGVLLLRAVIEHGFREGFARVDLLLGDQGHKRRWSTDSYETFTVLAASNRAVLLAGTASLAVAARARAARQPREITVSVDR